jgi:hypothetical protein
MNKSIKHSFKGMMQDVAQSQFNNDFYFEGRNIRIVATDTQSTGSVTNEKGNSLILTIPTPIINYPNKEINYNDNYLNYENNEINNQYSSISQSQEQIIIGHTNIRDGFVIFSTDNHGFDCIWRINYNNFSIRLLYLRNLGFSTNNPIQVLNNFENEKIDKVYWVDSKYQMRFININHSLNNGDYENLIDLPSNVINTVGTYDLNQPSILKLTTGGTHTAGRIQYVYNLYRLNSSQTKLSPFSEMVSLTNGTLGGGNVNEKVTTVPVIYIKDIDKTWTNIRTYAIKYTSYNEQPSISLIDDREIPTSGNLEIFDDGSIISTLSLEEFLFLGSDIIIPKHINSKFNRLFYSNYKEINFEVNKDFRAYSFDSSQICKIYDNIKIFKIGDITPNINGITGHEELITDVFTNEYNYKNDSINLNHDVYKYQYDGITNGGEGKYIKYELTQSTVYDKNATYFKDQEIYRTAIQFYNKYGQKTTPYWIADFRSLDGNLEGNYNTFKITLKPEFYIWLNNSSNFTSDYDIPIGYKVLIAERTLNDRTIVSNGILSTMMFNHKSNIESYSTSDVKQFSKENPKLPNILLRNCNETFLYGNTQPLKRCEHLENLVHVGGGPNPANEVTSPYYGDSDASGKFWQFNPMIQLYSPEILFNKNISLTSGLKLRIKGSLKNVYNASWNKEENLTDGSINTESKVYSGISPFYSNYRKNIIGSAYNNLDKGILAHPGGSEPNTIETNLFYRAYGNILITDIFSSNIIVNIPNTLNIISGSDPSNSIIYNSNYNNSISIKLTPTVNHSLISYTIFPDILNISTPYTIKICSDQNGQNVLSELTNVIGVQNITHNDTLSPSSLFDKTYDYFLVIDTAVNYKCTINISASVSGASSLVKQSNGNIVDINIHTNTFTNYYNKGNNTLFDLYGIPEITEKGQDFTTYNNDLNYRYSNSLQSCLTDGDSSYSDGGVYGRRIVSVNSDNNRCITFVTGDNDITVENWNRKSLENLFYDSGLDGDNNGLIGELVKSNEEIYLGGIYGGNTYEDKKRTNYIEIGDYQNIINNVVTIESPGDTYVQNFRFLRIVRKETDVKEQGTKQFEEIIEYTTETTIDLKNRNDVSFGNWDSKFQIRDADYHNYNYVYSQTQNLILNRDNNYLFKKVKNFDTNIITSKVKVAGEIIDNWTDILQNEVMTLDGKYGSINSLHNFKDELYAIQDNAIACISVQPRVQVQGSDGIAVQLGTGNVLERYKYLSTELGTRNKWSVINSPTAFYFYDSINNNLQICSGQNVDELSDLKGMHTFFVNNIDETYINRDNPIINSGICTGYDYLNNEVFFTFLQNNKSFTLNFDDNTKTFVSRYDYLPTRYLSKGNHFLAVEPNSKSIYKQYDGEYNKFFGQYYPSYIILNVNPEYDVDCVFDNINFKSECYLNNIDQPDKTLTHIQAYSDYQNSSLEHLILGRNNNLRRKFRDWNALIPRQQNKRERIRGNYIKLKLQFDNTNNYKFILHPLNVFYTV